MSTGSTDLRPEQRALGTVTPRGSQRLPRPPPRGRRRAGVDDDRDRAQWRGGGAVALEPHRRLGHGALAHHRAAAGHGVRLRHRQGRTRRRLPDRQRDAEHRLRAAHRRGALGDAGAAVHRVPRARTTSEATNVVITVLVDGDGRADRRRRPRRPVDLRSVHGQHPRGRRPRADPAGRHAAHAGLPAADLLLRRRRPRQRRAQRSAALPRRGVEPGARQPRRHRHAAVAPRPRPGSSPTSRPTSGCAGRSPPARRSASPRWRWC